MKIAVTSQGVTLDDELDPRFGRAQYFLIVNTETMEYTAVNNSQNYDLPQGAGIQAAQNVIKEEVKALLTGNCGPKAFKTLDAASIEVYAGAKGTVREAVEQFKTGALTKAQGANVEGHWV